MTNFNTTPLSEDTIICQSPYFYPPPEIQEKLDILWNQGIYTQPKLFNGKIYVLVKISDNTLEISESEYKLSFGLKKSPDLISRIPVRPLAVTGLLICPEGLVLGQRGRDVTSETGLWEPAPSGSLSHPNPKTQILEELAEELGLTADLVHSINYLGIIEDLASGIIDIILEIRTNIHFKEIVSFYEGTKNHEYDALICKPLSEINCIFDDFKFHYIGLLPEALKLFGLSK